MQQNSLLTFLNAEQSGDNIAQSISIAELLQRVSDTVQTYHTASIWVRAEVASYKQHNGHHYLTLVHRTKDTAQEIARIQAHIWRSRAYIIKHFEENTKQTLGESLKILVECRVRLHIKYGLSLDIQKLDYSYTIGNFMQKVSQIRNRLQQQGVIANNRELPIDEVISCIAVISPVKAAGLADFNHIIEPLLKYQLLKCDYFPATFQGEQAPQSIVNALTNIQKSEQPYQLVVIIRGGGNITDLQHLEDYCLLEKICLDNTPIWVGIGHEINYMTIDQVANQSFITPTELANCLLKNVLLPYKRAREMWQYCLNEVLLSVNNQKRILAENSPQVKLIGLAKLRLEKERAAVKSLDSAFQRTKSALLLNRQKLSQALQQIRDHARYQINYQQSSLKYQNAKINHESLKRLSYQREQNKRFMKSISLRAPIVTKSVARQLYYYQQVISQNHWQKILQRGYAIIRDMNGKVISQSANLQCRKKYSLQMKDGRIFFKVEGR